MNKKEILKKKLAQVNLNNVDWNPLPKWGVQKKNGKTFFNTPIQRGRWRRERAEGDAGLA